MESSQKVKELEGKLARYQAKLAEMAKQSPDSGGRYGDEYLDEQIRVSQTMIAILKKEILDLKRKTKANEVR